MPRSPHRAIAPLLLALSLQASADVVQTAKARHEGQARLRPDRIEIGGAAVRWDELLFLVRHTDQRPLFDRDTVRPRSGEAWVADAFALAGQKLKLRLPLCGEREIELAQLASIDFVPRLPPQDDAKAATLYREQGEPVPGKLLWLDPKQIAIDSPLGVLEIPRKSAVRYVVASGARPSPAEGEDEVTLTDGSVFRGRLKAADNAIELAHAVLGRLAIPAGAVRGIVRHPPQVVYLAEAKPHAVEAAPLILRPPVPETVEPTRLPAAWLKGVRVEPKTSLRYRLPDAGGRKLVFRSGLEPLAGAKGAVQLRVAAGGRALFDQQLAPQGKWPALSLDLPQAGELTVEVDFGASIRFPCGVVLCDPHVARQ